MLDDLLCLEKQAEGAERTSYEELGGRSKSLTQQLIAEWKKGEAFEANLLC